MLDPKTKIFIFQVPRRYRSTVRRGARTYGAPVWFAGRCAQFESWRASPSAGFPVQPAWLSRRKRRRNPDRAGKGLPHRTRERTPAALHRPAPRTLGWSELRSVHCCRNAAARAAIEDSPRKLAAPAGWAGIHDIQLRLPPGRPAPRQDNAHHEPRTCVAASLAQVQSKTLAARGSAPHLPSCQPIEHRFPRRPEGDENAACRLLRETSTPAARQMPADKFAGLPLQTPEHRRICRVESGRFLLAVCRRDDGCHGRARENRDRASLPEFVTPVRDRSTRGPAPNQNRSTPIAKTEAEFHLRRKHDGPALGRSAGNHLSPYRRPNLAPASGL